MDMSQAPSAPYRPLRLKLWPRVKPVVCRCGGDRAPSGDANSGGGVSLGTPSQEIRAHLWRTYLLELVWNTLVLIAGVGRGGSFSALASRGSSPCTTFQVDGSLSGC